MPRQKISQCPYRARRRWLLGHVLICTRSFIWQANPRAWRVVAPPQSGWGEKIRLAVYERLRCKSGMNGSCDERTQASPTHAAHPSMQQPAVVESVRASAKPARESKPIRWG